MDVVYSKRVGRRVRKRKLPSDVWVDFRDAFKSLADTKNFRLFDIKKLTDKGQYRYYRLRLGRYRALFWIEKETIYVEDIGPRGEIYKP